MAMKVYRLSFIVPFKSEDHERMVTVAEKLQISLRIGVDRMQGGDPASRSAHYSGEMSHRRLFFVKNFLFPSMKIIHREIIGDISEGARDFEYLNEIQLVAQIPEFIKKKRASV